MRPLRVKILCCSLLLWAAAAEPASAAWNNVFQATCFFRRRQTTTSQYVAAPVVVQSSPVVAAVPAVVADPCNPCPQTQCTTSYVQRCYYEPVTTYQTQTYYEPVTTYRTSYYYEPVTTYRYRCYFDPCTCSYQQVAVPTTCYQLRSQVCPVQTWVQRCAQVPVTSYRKCCYWQPQTTCCTTTVGAPIAAPPVVQPNGSATIQQPANGAPPVVTPQLSPPANPPQQQDRYYGPIEGSNSKNSNWQMDPRQPGSSPVPARPQPAVPSRIASGPTWVQGQVVRSDSAPRPNATVVFIHADRRQVQHSATANSAGRFHVSLAAGRWDVYIRTADGTQTYHSQIDVRDERSPFVTLVSR